MKIKSNCFLQYEYLIIEFGGIQLKYYYQIILYSILLKESIKVKIKLKIYKRKVWRNIKKI